MNIGDKFSGLSWPDFVDLLLRNKLSQRENAQPEVNEADPWVANHWAPFWFTCGMCLPSLRPDFILHLDKIAGEARLLLSHLGITNSSVVFPRELEGEGGHSETLLAEYYGQLS